MRIHIFVFIALVAAGSGCATAGYQQISASHVDCPEGDVEIVEGPDYSARPVIWTVSCKERGKEKRFLCSESVRAQGQTTVICTPSR